MRDRWFGCPFNHDRNVNNTMNACEHFGKKNVIWLFGWKCRNKILTFSSKAEKSIELIKITNAYGCEMKNQNKVFPYQMNVSMYSRSPFLNVNLNLIILGKTRDLFWLFTNIEKPKKLNFQPSIEYRHKFWPFIMSIRFNTVRNMQV